MAKGRGDTVEKLFSPKRQYEIPIYQRRYVWGIENWDALWTDIQEKFDRRVNGEKPTSHFTGIIITRKDEKEQGLPKYQILDGQQRLTTFQILLCVIRDLCQSKNYTLRADSADLLVKNKGYNEKYKLYPKEGFDEKAFCALVDSEPRGDHVIHRAYNHFMDAITNDIGIDSPNIDHLYNAITNDFHMVQIDLKRGDEPEKIFASLNATGRMLDEFDHLRNDLFLKAGDAGTNLYNTCWSHFDTDSYWEDPGNLDQFLRHFLQATVNPECFQTQEGEKVKAFDVYLKQYRSKLQPDQDIEYEFRKLKKYSKVYQEMDDPNSRIGSRMKFYKEFDIEDMFPFILFIISEFSEFVVSEDEPEIEFLLSETDFELIFDILESYMMRRMLRWGRDYDYKSIDMVKKFHNICLNKKSFSLPKFIAHLANRGSDRRHQDKWSTDPEVNGTLTEEWHVDITEGIRYILYRIEKKIREEKNIPVIDFTDTLRLERIMPTKWEYSLNWQLPLEEGSDRCIPYDKIFTEEHKKNNKSWRKADPSAEGLVDQSYSYALDLAKKRRKNQKSIGNLTLVDVEIDTDEFTEKKPYFKDFHLEINEVIYESENWDAPQIEKRAEKLLPHFHKLWPAAEYFVKTYLSPYLSTKYPIGTKITGTIQNITDFGAFIEFGDGIIGLLRNRELSWIKRLYLTAEDLFKEGDEVEVVILKIDVSKQPVSLGYKQLQPNPWDEDYLEQNYSIGTKVTGLIRRIEDYGAFVDFGDGITGLLHNSELSWTKRNVSSHDFFKVSDEVEVVILNIDVSEQHVSLGYKQLQPNPWDEDYLEQNYSIGTKVTGLIRRIEGFGAFVDFEDGIAGLLHNNELSWTKRLYLTAEDLFKEGDEVEVVILNIYVSEQHVSLGYKQLQPNPWDEDYLGQNYPIGTKVTGLIRQIEGFGAFVDFGDGIAGLLHNNELFWTKRLYLTAKDLFKEGDEVEVVILNIDVSEQHVSLGYKQLQPNPWDEDYLGQNYPIGTKVTGLIRQIKNYGTLVEFGDGIIGLLRNTELSWTNRKASAKNFFEVGSEVEVVILKIDVAEQQVLLSLKQLKPNPWKLIEERYPIGTRVTGHIRKIKESGEEAGAVVETEDFDGLIRTTDISWVNHSINVHDFFEIDDKIEAVILKIVPSEERVYLGFKQLFENPWKLIEEKYPIGTRVTGHIRKIKKVGVVVEFKDGLCGFIHISELTNQEIEKPGDIVSVGQELDLKVIHVSSADRQIKLSLKRMSHEAQLPRWVSMMDSKTIMFTTDRGRKELSEVKVDGIDVIGINYEGKESTISIQKDVLFAYLKEAYQKVPYKIPRNVSQHQLKTEQLDVDDITLKSAQENRFIVTAIVRSGYELKGIIEGVDKDAIYMRINEKIVIVFRHSLIEFRPHEKVSLK